MKYLVKIEERLCRMVAIEAENEKEATERAERLYSEAKIVLDMTDYEGEPHITCYGTSFARPDMASRVSRVFDKEER